MLRVVPSRSGTTAWACADGFSPDGYTEASSPSAASAHTRIRGFDFALPFCGRMGPYETRLHSASRDTPVSRINNGSLKAASGNFLLRVQVHFPSAPRP